MSNIVKNMVVAPDTLKIEWQDGRTHEFLSLWLRDNLREDRDPHSGQRLIDIADLPADPKIRTASLRDNVLEIAWESEDRIGTVDLQTLDAQAAGPKRWPERQVLLWLDGAQRDAYRDFAWAPLPSLKSQRRLRAEWLTRLLQQGLAFVSGLPATDEAILETMSVVGRVVDTHYGTVFDVRSVPRPENLAYSDLALGLHTDNPYREPVPGFQALHTLMAAPDGGDSLFADGFAIAEHLRQTDPAAFGVLTQTAVPFFYRSERAELYAERPLIQLSCQGEVIAVHYNSRSIAALKLPQAAVAAFYAAYRSFAALLRDPALQIRFRLRSGDLAVFDNRRTLHGRTAFSSTRHPRLLRGCYLTRDSVFSEAALLRRLLMEEEE